ncbi:MAG TPA: Uma2 family endonuclease [Pirellulales bacterium]|nr:Uma2 family endonuclease [Pirellulales bacterium]
MFHDWRRDGHAAVGEHDGCYDSSFTYDTQKKAPLYAKGGVREYWVIDLNSNRVLVYTRPRAGQYSIIRTQNRGDRFTSQRFPGIEFKVRDLLP